MFSHRLQRRPARKQKFCQALWFCLFLVTPLFAHQSALPTGPLAAQITAENAGHYRVGGIDAQGGIGDWFLSNGTICAIISNSGQESVLTYQGGFLTDLGFCGREDDHFLAYYPALNMSLEGVMLIDSIESVPGTDGAEIRTSGEKDGIRISIDYRVTTDNPDVLSIHTELERINTTAEFKSYGEAVLTADSMQMFSLSSTRQAVSRGFQQIENEITTADVTVLLGTGDPGHNIAYGYRLVDAKLVKKGATAVPIQALSMTGVDVSARFLMPAGGLEAGDKLLLKQEIILAKTASVAPITDKIWPNGQAVHGHAEEAGVVLLIEDESGAAVTHTFSSPSGDFFFNVPAPGNYKARIRAQGRREVSLPFSVFDEDVQLPDFRLAPAGVLELPRGQVMRLTFKGIDGGEDPRFTDPLTGYQVTVGEQVHQHGDSRHVFLSGDTSDAPSVKLAPGKYLVTASRGPEYSAHQTTVEMKSGSTQALKITTPTRWIETKGYVSADFHVHSGQSFDNNLDTRSRLKSYIAQGGEVLVATEHDTVYDFSQLISEMGFDALLKTVTGTELTTELGNPTAPYGIGHANVFPMQVQPFQPRRGAPKHENHRWRDIIATLRQQTELPLVQLNHPRGSTTEGLKPGLYLSHLAMAGKAYDPHSALTEFPNSVMLEADPKTGIRDIDFDIIEIENGNFWGKRYEITRDDWFSLLRQGQKISAAANSDSHGVVNGALAANVRNMVFTGANSLDQYEQGTFIAAIRSANYYGTNGPLLDVALNGVTMGGLASGKRAELKLKVVAADWMRVDHYKLYINGELNKEGTLRVNEVVNIPLSFDQDAFVTVEVSGEVTEVSREVIGRAAPFAFSNPIFFDADGDGKWTPIGTPLPRAPE